jgi:hypothetical protein
VAAGSAQDCERDGKVGELAERIGKTGFVD